MIAALDVDYDGRASTATAAAVLFQDWNDAEPHFEYKVICYNLQAYIPGEFFKRELPCLMAVLAVVREPLNAILIDGYVSLGLGPGLGQYLWVALNEKTPIIGIAKTRYHSASAIEIIRGESQTPLYVTAVGIDPGVAAQKVSTMAGEHRIPAMLKRVDKLSRSNRNQIDQASGLRITGRHDS